MPACGMSVNCAFVAYPNTAITESKAVLLITKLIQTIEVRSFGGVEKMRLMGGKIMPGSLPVLSNKDCIAVLFTALLCADQFISPVWLLYPGASINRSFKVGVIQQFH